MNDEFYQKALIDPSDHFKNPAEVLLNEKLSKQQKVEVLKRWKHDEQELEIATDENMSNKISEKDILNEVIEALRMLED